MSVLPIFPGHDWFPRFGYTTRERRGNGAVPADAGCRNRLSPTCLSDRNLFPSIGARTIVGYIRRANAFKGHSGSGIL